MPPETCGYQTLELISLKVVEASPDAKIVVDHRGIIVIFNTRAELLFGCDRSDVIGKSVETLLPETLREGHTKQRSSWFRRPSTRQMGAGISLMALHQQTKEGFEVIIELSPIVVPNSGLFGLAVIRPK